METDGMFDRVSRAIERAMEGLEPPAAAAPERAMPLGAFVRHAVAEIRKAAAEPPAVAARRLACLKRAVDGAAGAIAKLNPEDVESARVAVEVFTAWAPSTADGDRPLEELTTAVDQASGELPAAGPPPSGGTLGANLDEVTKALERVGPRLDGLRARPTDPGRGAGDASWPLDLNSADFRRGVAKSETPPAWGYDPAGEPARRA